MKKMKRLAAFLLAMVMVLAMSMPAMAATITVPNETQGDQNNTKETYTAYKIFDVTTVEIDGGKGYAYSIAKDNDWVSVLQDIDNQTWFELAASSDGSVYNVSLKEGITNDDTTAKKIAAYLLNNKPDNVTGTTLNAGDNTVDDGYYLITSSLGSNLALATTDISVNITEKNTYPSLTKAVDKETASIGDKVTFTITLTVPESVDKDIVVHDKMEKGFTLVDNNGTEFTAVDENNASVNFTKVASKADTDCTFELSFAADAAKGKTITITYEATLNANAEISTDTNDNSAWLTYSNFESTPQTVQVKTYKFDLVKTGVENEGAYSVLEGAKFKLYDAETNGNEIALVKDSTDGSYRPALTGETGVEIEAGEVTIKGLGNGTYYLEETKAPDGYNKLTARIGVTIDNANLTNTPSSNNTYTKEADDTGVQVINETGNLLPSTGGMGTTIFYILGGILVIGAGVLLVTRKRLDLQKK